MEPMLVVSGVVAAAFVVALVGGKRQRDVSQAWRTAAERLGLEFTPAPFGGTLTGSMEGLLVTARAGVFQDGAQTRMGMDLEVSGGISTRLSANRFTGLDYGRVFHAAGEMGDDEQLARAAAVLTSSAQTRLGKAVDALDARVEHGAVRVTRSDVPTRADEVEALVRELVAVARGLSVQGRKVDELLLENLERETLPDVRDHMHRLLLRRYGDTEAGRRAMELAARSHDPGVRLARALRLEDGRFEALEALVRSPDVRSSLRLEALSHLSTEDDTRITGVLGKLLGDVDAGVRRAAVREVRRERDAPLVRPLLAMAEDADAGTAVDLVRALARLGDAAAEPLLVDWLGREGVVRETCVEALARLGTVAAVEPLLALADAGDEAARRAIDAIQARLGDVEAGRLSVVKPSQTEGALSLAEPEGELSFADEDPGKADGAD